MVRSLVFDLDGTLVRTEDLKALSYARAALELRPGAFSERDVIEGYQNVIGQSRQEVSESLLRQFELGEALVKRRKNGEPLWGTFASIRLGFYEQMLSNQEVLAQYECPYNVALLNRSKSIGLRSGLATMSHAREAFRVLDLLGIGEAFGSITTREDVERGKPHPEIYELSARRLNVLPFECLVIEDSPSGITAALAAGCHCIAVTTDLTRKKVHESGLLSPEWIVDDPARLLDVATRRIGQES